MSKLHLSAILLITSINFFSPKFGLSQVDLEIPSTTIAPVIDGVIDDVWANDDPKPLLKILEGGTTTASDFSAYFKILWDASALYILVDVTDDVKVNDSESFWEDDAFELYFDIGNDKQTFYGSNDYQSVIGWNDPNIVTGPSTGVVFKVVGTATGYLLEVKYPWSTLGLTSPHDGVLLGLDVHVHDDDDGGGRDNKLAWFTTVDLSYQNPSLFATAVLMNSTPMVIDMQIPSTEIAPVIDGTIDEAWSIDNSKPQQKVLESATTPTDLSAYQKAIWDASGLYVLTVVTDETKINDSGGETWKDDGIEVYIDIDNNKQTTYGANDYQYTFRWNDLSIYPKNGSTVGIEFIISGTPTGYIFEAKFPWTTLGLASPRSGIILGYDVHVNDDDNGGERDHKIAWFTTDDNSWNNPSLFANAKLTGNAAMLYPADKPKISVDRGFYENPFDVSISTALPGMSIYYTLDGSDPATSPTATVAFSPAVVRIDPESSVNRGKTPAVVLRARAKKSGYDFSAPVTRSYLFKNKMALQADFPGHNWPSGNRINSQEIDLLMDSRILNDNRYQNIIDDAFIEIPSISISTDQENLFDPASGIYVNAWDGRGIDWERPASVELINPDGADGFQIDAGIRIRGGWSRNGYFRKHAFRLFFRNEYGEGKLDFPLFEKEGVDKFDKIDLRCPQNYSWSKGDPGEAQYCTFNRDVFSRDLQREMNQPYTRSRYYHLFINGLYWGVFQTQERSEAKYAETYLGGSADDYDVIKRVGNQSIIEATDGTTDSWRAVWDICQQGFTSNTNYKD
jgi:hypothetical protein